MSLQDELNKISDSLKEISNDLNSIKQQIEELGIPHQCDCELVGIKKDLITDFIWEMRKWVAISGRKTV